MKNRKEFKNVVRKKYELSQKIFCIFITILFSFNIQFLMRKNTEESSDSAALFNFSEITYSADGSGVSLQKKGLSLSLSNI